MTEIQRETNREACRRWRKNTNYRAKSREQRRTVKKEIIDHYGGYCSCCGEDCLDFLTLDHMNNDGAQQRKAKGKLGWSFYYDIIKNGYPDDLQVLCINCNWGKYRNNGICPHETMRLKVMKN